MAVLTHGLDNLRDQMNARWPNRDKTSDGWLGDAAHQTRTSGHNPDDKAGSKAAWNADPDTVSEVRALDVDADLGEPGSTAQMLVDHIRKLPGVSSVLRYMIYKRKIYHSRDGWAPTAYSGSNPHDKHIHFEGGWTQAADNNTTYNYRLNEVGRPPTAATEDEDMPLTNADVKKIWDYLLIDPYDKTIPPRKLTTGTWLRYTGDRGRQDSGLKMIATVQAMLADLGKLAIDAGADRAAIAAKIDAIQEAIDAGMAPTMVAADIDDQDETDTP